MNLNDHMNYMRRSIFLLIRHNTADLESADLGSMFFVFLKFHRDISRRI